MRTQPEAPTQGLSRSQTAQVIFRVTVFILGLGLVLFGSSGRLDWTPAWLFLCLQSVGVSANAWLTLKRNPGLIAERSSIKPDVKRWDRLLSPLMAWGGLISILLAGLEQRFRPDRPDLLLLTIATLIVAGCGYALASWALACNPFFSALVRIQSDRGHVVVDRGPYRWVRHPGYVGALLINLALPAVFSSWWALLPAGLTVLATLVRTALEDRMLQIELPGYAEYAVRVRWRLLPAVW